MKHLKASLLNLLTKKIGRLLRPLFANTEIQSNGAQFSDCQPGTNQFAGREVAGNLGGG